MFWFIVVQNKVINLLELLLYILFGVYVCGAGSDECARVAATSSVCIQIVHSRRNVIAGDVADRIK